MSLKFPFYITAYLLHYFAFSKGVNNLYCSADLVTQCAVACVDNWRCESFSYSIIHNTCILSEAEEESDWEHDQDYNSYLRSAISLDQVNTICPESTENVEYVHGTMVTKR